MSVWEWWAWAGLLVAQNASFTLVLYHAGAGILSNGVWFAGQFILFGNLLRLLHGTWTDALMIGGWYTLWTLLGSVGMHWIAMHKIEKKVKANVR